MRHSTSRTTFGMAGPRSPHRPRPAVFKLVLVFIAILLCAISSAAAGPWDPVRRFPLKEADRQPRLGGRTFFTKGFIPGRGAFPALSRRPLNGTLSREPRNGTSMTSNTILGADDRVQISPTTDFPWTSIVHLDIDGAWMWCVRPSRS